MAQTTVQRTAAVRLGSAKVEVGDSVAALVDLGAMRGVQIAESFDKVSVESDNAGTLREYIKNQRVAITGQMIEIDLDSFNKIRGGIDTYSTVAGGATPVTDEQVVLSGTLLKRLANKNGDGTEVTAIVVTDLTGVTTYVLNTDYVVALDAAGYTVIARIAGGSIGDGDTVLVDYSYTPATSKILSSGGKHTISPKVVRLTNTDANGKKLQVTVYYATVEEGITLEFPSDEADDVMVSPINMVGKVDVSRTVGDQLYEILDEQSTT